MMKDRTVAIIAVRMTSTRMPGKVIKPIIGKPALQHLLERLSYLKKVDEITVATSSNAADAPIEKLCRDNGVRCFRGSELDVLGRIRNAAEAFDADHILYICGDSPCIDPVLGDELVEYYHGNQLDYASNCEENTYPIGLGLEVFSRNAIRRLDEMTNDPWDREHVTEFFYTHPDIFKCGLLRAPIDLTRPQYRLCIDLPVDFEIMEKLFSALYREDKAFTTPEIVNYLDSHPEVAGLNSAMKDKKYRCAVVGLGNIGMKYDIDFPGSVIWTHSAGYMKCSRTKLDALCDSDPQKRSFARSYFSIDNVFEDMTSMIAERMPEIVSICTPHSMHMAQAIAAAEHSSVRAIFCEKPMAVSSAEGEQILAACRKNNVQLVVNYWMRYSSLYQDIKEKLDQGYFGKVQHVQYTYSKGTLNSCSHAINLMLYWFGLPKWVQAGCQYDIGTDDANIDGQICMMNGVMIHLSCCDWRHHFTTDQSIYGTDKMIRIERNGKEVLLRCKATNPVFPDSDELALCSDITLKTDIGSPMLRAIDDIVELLDGIKATSISPGEDDYITIKILEALKKSCELEGKRIFL